MATLLELRKKHNQRTILFLGSRAGGLFRSSEFYNILQAFSKHDFATMSRLEQFYECYNVLRQGLFSERDMFTILSSSLRGLSITHADRCLANLVRDGFFDVVISTNIDDVLEQAYVEVGMRELEHFHVLIPRSGADLEVIYSQKNVSCWLIKVFGDLASRSYNILTRNTHLADTQYPQLRGFLEKSLSGDILVIGLDPVWDAGVLAAFPFQGGSYWFVNEEIFGEQTLVASTWHGRHVKYISGSEGSYERFLKDLYWYLGKEQDPKNYQSLVDVGHPLQEIRFGSAQVQLSTPQEDSEVLSAPENHLADVLLVTITEEEALAVLSRFPDARLHHIGDRTYHDLGVIGAARTFMVQSWKGAGGPGGALFTVAEGIQAVSPSAIIMLGIAFGFHPKKQSIGDILISQKLLGYDLQRIGTSGEGQLLIYPRGDRVSASVRLVSRFKAGKLTINPQDWPKQPSIKFGLILSGSKLIDNRDFRDQLLAMEPEAIGGEMEGAGLYDAAQRYKVDWILVKAISDWADGKKHFKKEERQKLAANNAARFVLHVLWQGGFAALQQHGKP